MGKGLLLLIGIIGVISAFPNHAKNPNNIPCHMPNGNPQQAILRAELENASYKFIDDMIGYHWANVSSALAVDAEMCITARVDIGCFVGIDHIMSYLPIIDPSITEMLKQWRWRNYRTTIDTVQRYVQLLTEWDFYSFSTAQNYTVTTHIYITYDCDNKITFYSALADSQVYVEAQVPQISDHNITRICNGGSMRPDLPFLPGIQQVCTGANQVYNSVADCVNFLSTLPLEDETQFFGTGNTLGCRDWHLGMARVDPAMHCPHVSVNGGGKCCNPGQC